MSGSSPVRGFASLFIGLFIATIGIDVAVGHPRYTFGSIELLGGVSLIPAMIGMFALSEIMRVVSGRAVVAKPAPARVGNVFSGLGAALRRYKLNIGRSSVLGTGIGSLPGAGADIAAWIAFTVSRRFSRTPQKFGKGAVEGIVDAGAANNAAVAGAWTPALVFGIPGDTVTAIAIGVLMLKDLTPRPNLFEVQAAEVYSVFVVFFIANLVLLPVGFAAIRAAGYVLRVPRNILMPVILMFCMVGAFRHRQQRVRRRRHAGARHRRLFHGGQRHPHRPGDPRLGARQGGRGQFHAHHDPRQRRSARLFRSTDRHNARGSDRGHMGAAAGWRIAKDVEIAVARAKRRSAMNAHYRVAAIGSVW